MSIFLLHRIKHVDVKKNAWCVFNLMFKVIESLNLLTHSFIDCSRVYSTAQTETETLWTDHMSHRLAMMSE